MMKTFINHRIAICLMAGWVGACYSCSDDWDNHYDANGSVPEANLMEVISNDAELSTFCRILKTVGYDSLLTSNQTYTVFAPENGALGEVDFSDLDHLRRLAGNHIARYSNPTSTVAGRSISMLNGKVMSYVSATNFNGAALSRTNILAGNGVLQTLSDTLVYRYNLLEYIAGKEQYSDFYHFICSFDEQKYDAALSTTYDSAFVDYNRLLESPRYGIGSIMNEDSLYTMIIPDNAAWQAAYDAISPYYNVYDKDEALADSIRRVQAQLAIVSGLTFRGRQDQPALADSLQTVGGNVLYQTEAYFAGYRQVEASNGLMYLASGSLNADDTCIWNHSIRVEAEDLDSRVSLTGTSAFIRNTDVNSLVQGVSNSGYLEVSGSSVDPGVTFDIANTLSGKYDIYVDFVAPRVDGEKLASEQTRVLFQLKYRTATGSYKTVTNRSNDLLVGGEEAPDLITLKAWEGVELPVSNFYDGMWYMDERHTVADINITTTLQIKTNVKSSELNKTLVRKFRVDRIRFVPVL